MSLPHWLIQNGFEECQQWNQISLKVYEKMLGFYKVNGQPNAHTRPGDCLDDGGGIILSPNHMFTFPEDKQEWVNLPEEKWPGGYTIWRHEKSPYAKPAGPVRHPLNPHFSEPLPLP